MKVLATFISTKGYHIELREYNSLCKVSYNVRLFSPNSTVLINLDFPNYELALDCFMNLVQYKRFELAL